MTTTSTSRDRTRTPEARGETLRRASIRAAKYARARSVDSIRASLQCLSLQAPSHLVTIDGGDR